MIENESPPLRFSILNPRSSILDSLLITYSPSPFHAVSAGLFGQVKFFIGLADELRGSQGLIPLSRRHAHADGYLERLVFKFKGMLGHRLAVAFRRPSG